MGAAMVPEALLEKLEPTVLAPKLPVVHVCKMYAVVTRVCQLTTAQAAVSGVPPSHTH